MSVLFGVLIAGGGINPAFALAITAAQCDVQADNALRFDCTVTTDAASHAFIKFGNNNAAGCQEVRSTSTSFNMTNHTFVVYGMKASTQYDWKAYASPVVPGAVVNSGCLQDTTDALPGGANTPRLDKIVVTDTVVAGSRQVNNFLTHYGCLDEGSGELQRNAFVIVDKDGDIVWYQEPDIDLNSSENRLTLEAVSLSRPDKHIFGIINHEIIVEYDLEGNLVHLVCRDDGTGYCPGTSETPDLFFDEYVHHDVQWHGGKLWALNAKDISVADDLDCDGDLNYTETKPIIVDGFYGFEFFGAPSVETDWDWRDAGVTVDYTVATSCTGGGYWGSQLLGHDYMHTNSFWIDAASQWIFSLRKQSDVLWVDGDPGSGTYEDLMDEFDGDGVGGNYTHVAGGFSEAIIGQHAAHWGPAGELVVFDNHYGGGGVARGVMYDLDDSAGTASAAHSYTMKDGSAANVTCGSGGSAYALTGGNFFATCPETGTGASRRAVFNEFFADDATSPNLRWTVEMQCDNGGTNYDAVATAFRGYPNVW